MSERYVDPYEKELEKEYKRSIGEKESFRGVTCREYFGETCLLCKKVRQVMFNKDSVGTPARTVATKYNQQYHYYSDFYFVTSPNEVEVLEYGPMIFKQLIQMQREQSFQEYKDFIHPDKGRNIQIRKTAGSGNNKPTYQVIPRENASKIIDPTVLNKMHDLNKIVDLIKFGEVKAYRQSQLPMPIVELRILPSFGMNTAMFFKKIPFHWISDDEYEDILKGEYDPFLEVTSGAPMPMGKPAMAKDGSLISKIVNTPIDKLNLQTLTGTPAGFQPGCLSEYNEFDQECTDCTWKDPCKEQMVNKRRAAKNLTPPKG